MINRLLSFLDASPVNFLAVKNIADSLEAAGFRRLDARQPLGEVKAGDCLFATKNASSVYAFRIGRQPLSEAGFHMICAHSDSPTFRIKPNAEMLTEGGLVKLNTEVYGGPIMSTWFDRPLTLAGRVIVRGDDVMHPITMLMHIVLMSSEIISRSKKATFLYIVLLLMALVIMKRFSQFIVVTQAKSLNLLRDFMAMRNH